jgi:hypothetical protein
MILCLLTLTSCEAETIFKAGMWWGIIVVCRNSYYFMAVFEGVKTLNQIIVWKITDLESFLI